VKNNLPGYFKLENMKRNSIGYPSFLFFAVECASNSHVIACLFSRYFQGFYSNDVLVENAYGSISKRAEMLAVLSLLQFTEGDVKNTLPLCRRGVVQGERVMGVITTPQRKQTM
jgi:hypothetical protein